MNPPIYLDYMSTTPVDPAVQAEMLRYLSLDGHFGNPSSRTHIYGWHAEQALLLAAQRLAQLIGADAREIVWTSGATESINLALKAASAAYARQGRHLITCETEHMAVLETCRFLERQGYTVTYLAPQPDGLLALDDLRAAIREDTILVSIAHVNNEIGVIQDIAAIGAFTRAEGILLHVDAAQSLGKLAIDVHALSIDLMSCSAHKVYGPKGIGALYVRRPLRSALSAYPLIHGGGQQGWLRSGTLATHQIAGMGLACEIAGACLEEEQTRLRAWRDQLWAVLRVLPGVHLNGSLKARVAHNLNVSIEGVHGETLLACLQDLALSSGSACHSARTEASHVLRAIGRSRKLADSTLRLSVGRFTTQEEVDQAGALLVGQIKALLPGLSH